MKTILITGGTGFIGSNLIRFLNKKNVNIYSTYNKTKPIQKKNNIKYIKFNLKKNFKLKLKKKFDFIIHLAWIGIPNLNYKNSVENLKLNIDFLNWIIKNKITKKLIIAGSCLEYYATNGSCKEDDKIHNFKNFFSFSKISIYNFLCTLNKKYNFKFYWLRIFFLFGPNQRSGALIPYLNKCKKNSQKPLIKNIKSCEDYVHIDDLNHLILKIITKEGQSGIYNVGSGKLVHIKEILNSIYNTKLEKKLSKKGIYANLSKTKKQFGWMPKINILNFLKNNN